LNLNFWSTLKIKEIRFPNRGNIFRNINSLPHRKGCYVLFFFFQQNYTMKRLIFIFIKKMKVEKVRTKQKLSVRADNFNNFLVLPLISRHSQWRIVGICKGRWSSSKVGSSNGYISPCDIAELTLSALLRCSWRMLRDSGLLCGVRTSCRCERYIPSRGRVSHPSNSNLILVITAATFACNHSPLLSTCSHDFSERDAPCDEAYQFFFFCA